MKLAVLASLLLPGMAFSATAFVAVGFSLIVPMPYHLPGGHAAFKSAGLVLISL